MTDPTPEGLHALLNLCSTDRHLNTLCRDDRFWQGLYQRLHPEITEPPLGTWRHSYVVLIRSQELTITPTMVSNMSNLNQVIVDIVDPSTATIRKDFSARDINGKLQSFRTGDRILSADITHIERNFAIEILYFEEVQEINAIISIIIPVDITATARFSI